MSQEKISPLRPFQERVFECIMKGQSVILQAPTGSGKTRAALAPFLQNMAKGGHVLPHTCRYAVPMRVLANQFYREYQSAAANIDRYMATRLVKTYQEIGQDAVSIQTGEQSDDPQMESALTFCTIDQLLASFLAVPYGVDSIRANLNVGAVVGSYLVLDEFHLYPLLRDGKSCYGARTTAIEMLRLLKSTTPFVLMTATFSTSLLDRLKGLLGAEVENITSVYELNDIAQGRARTFELSELPISADTILKRHKGCSLVVCNTVLRAQELFLQLKERLGNDGPRLVLLHSRFTSEHRKALAEEVEHESGPEQWKDGIYLGRDMILVATQVVEVGLNISVRTLHTEIAPANSLIQRAGRCARFARQQGRVIVYPLPPDTDGKPANTRPYDTEICGNTLTALENFHEKVVGFREEQELINAVHTTEDEAMLDQFKLHRGHITSSIFQSFNTNNRSIVSTLIRDVSQVQILIHDDPDTAITSEPWLWQSFAMHPGSLAGRWKALQERKAQFSELDWMCKQAIAIQESDPDSIDNRQKTIYKWEEVTNPAELSQALMIALPGQLASYYEDLGFVLLDERLTIKPSGYQSTQHTRSWSGRGGEGSQQSYQEHIRGLVGAYDHNLRDEIHYVAHKLEQQMGLPTDIIDQAIRLAIACHDLGKLDRTWQQWAREWQKLLVEKQPGFHKLADPHTFLAKTDYDYSREQRDWQNLVKAKRPHHACESVILGRRLIAASLGLTNTPKAELLLVRRAICGAIARHHTPQASQFSIAHIDEAARGVAEEALKIAKLDRQWNYDISLLELDIPNEGDLAPASIPTPKLTRPESGPTSELETWLYFVIVRALRLADQREGMFS